jgi:epoxyqueuosine reductase
MLAVNYNSAAPRSTDPASPGQGWISRYAWSGAGDQPTDYHDVILSRLRILESRLAAEARQQGSEELKTRCYVDTGPIVERVYAKYASLGWIGKNTCLINQQLGSWLFLGTIVTSLRADAFGEESDPSPAPDRCGSCRRCIEACPTAAIVEPYQLDATRCIAYLTIEKRGAIPEQFRSDLGRHIFGCDICQDVCPWNRKAPVARIEQFQARPELVNPDLGEMARMSKEEFRKRFHGSPLERTKYSGFRRNLALAMGNSGEQRFLPLLREMAAGDDATVAEHARWAIAKLEAVSLTAKTQSREEE